ncbi:MAG: amidohydrolase family protein [Pseudomonadales bacterium]|nr:amidohydrolase family protein [Pseudomonadales bacterium]
MFDEYPLFDSHMHIIDKKFPLIPNNGYLPPEFDYKEYLKKMASYKLCGGVVVSGSFQAFDQSYLIEALKNLGERFVGVTQLPACVSDEEILRLNSIGIRAIRFNLKRGGSEEIKHLSSLASRAYELANWHVELYVDSKELKDLYPTLITLPSVSIDHLGLSKSGFKVLTQLVEKGVRVKATGFSRVDFDVATALKTLYMANPKSLMFGSDLPSTRAPRPYSSDDFILVADTLGKDAAIKVFSTNAIEFYKPNSANKSSKRGAVTGATS